MTERNGLRFAHTCVSNVGRTLDRVSEPDQTGNHKDCAKDSGARQRIRAAMKDLRHSLLRSSPERPGGAFRSFVCSVVFYATRCCSEYENHSTVFVGGCGTSNYKLSDSVCRGFFENSGKKIAAYLIRTLNFSTKRFAGRQKLVRYRGRHRDEFSVLGADYTGTATLSTISFST